MPYNSTHKYVPRSAPRCQKKPRRRAGPRYGLICMTALLIFACVLLLSRAGLGAAIEDAVSAAARNEGLAQSVMRLILPDHSASGEPLASEPAEASASAPDPFLPDEPDICEQSLSADELPAMPAPELAVFESIMPEIPVAQTPRSTVTALTIDGEAGGYEGSGSVYIRNETNYAIDVAALLKKKNPVSLSGSGVQVLIMHTHGTEAYTPDAVHTYAESDPDRTIDPTRNVLSVGDEIARVLEQNGISVVHSTALNDYPAYNGSYNRALEDIKKYLKDNPSIKVVIDVHRDAMTSQNGTKYKTVATIDGKQAAQLMFVAGTDQGGLSHDNWRDNLAFQLQLQDRMNTKYPGIMRPVNIRTGRFNQHVTAGSMLLEVGTNGNTLSEALYSAQLFAQQLADMLNGK